MRTMGKVKWFDRAKGEGCVVSEGGSQAVLPRAALQPFGLDAIDAGVALTYDATLEGGRLIVRQIFDIAGKPPGAGVRAKGRVSWYDPVKGYGFIVSNDIDGDVLLHRSVLQQIGRDAISKGDVVDFDLIKKISGYHVRRLHDVIESGEPADWKKAVCKWFSRRKGYGFVQIASREAFVHMDTLRKCGVKELKAAQRVRVRVSYTDKGMLVTEIEL